MYIDFLGIPLSSSKKEIARKLRKTVENFGSLEKGDFEDFCFHFTGVVLGRQAMCDIFEGEKNPENISKVVVTYRCYSQEEREETFAYITNILDEKYVKRSGEYIFNDGKIEIEEGSEFFNVNVIYHYEPECFFFFLNENINNESNGEFEENIDEEFDEDFDEDFNEDFDEDESIELEDDLETKIDKYIAEHENYSLDIDEVIEASHLMQNDNLSLEEANPKLFDYIVKQIYLYSLESGIDAEYIIENTSPNYLMALLPTYIIRKRKGLE